ncbi:MAG: FecR family protein, partial [Luteimonas sp.]
DAATAVGEIRSLRLGDGSVAILDTDSALKVEFGADRRRVRLYRGRARFEVARDPARPFVVDVPAGSARALEGRVEVRAAGGGSRAVLQAGQRAWLGDGGVVPGTDADADADSGGAAAWRDGQLVFYRAPLAEVVDELARYRRGAVYVRDERLRRMPVSGVFETADPDAGLAALEHTLQLRAIRLGRWLTVFY